ncbi:hypothetical protein, partial [Metabacillus lacus]|uniref:hypothetical protein n=1 Tax=Metabacillus lacus TaxID=1983721 RepID=UPI001BA68D61
MHNEKESSTAVELRLSRNSRQSFIFFLLLSQFTALIWYNIGNNSRMVNGMFKPKRESQNEAEFVFIED